jgi:hypothetical protein
VRLRFSIRDLFWLTLVVAMGLGWGMREWQLRAEKSESVRLWRGRNGGARTRSGNRRLATDVAKKRTAGIYAASARRTQFPRILDD